MINVLKSLGNFYLYSSLHIGICAALFTLESYLAFELVYNLNYILFIFLSTICSYSLHRLVGMNKTQAFKESGRYRVIRTYQRHIFLYFVLSGIAALYFFLHLSHQVKLQLSIPIVITLFYILPIFPKGKRLRDIHFVKIFLIAITWAWMCYGIPCYNLVDIPTYCLALLERILFVFAITIPFDIRDKDVDATIGVQTIVHLLGNKLSKFLSIGLLLVSFSLIVYLLLNQQISTIYFIAMIISYVITIVLVSNTKETHGDWYFGGLLDGTLGLRTLLILIVAFIY